jgi:ABC-type protease/lipase transport system fused ATPase/permease subunit
VAKRRRALAAVENVLALADGRVAALGRKEEVLNAVLRQSPAPRARLQRTGTQ